MADQSQISYYEKIIFLFIYISRDIDIVLEDRNNNLSYWLEEGIIQSSV